MLTIEKLPLRLIDFDVPADKARHDRLVHLVEKMLTLKTDYESAFASKRIELNPEIEQTSQQIDTLVYELYKLTADDIAMVERQRRNPPSGL